MTGLVIQYESCLVILYELTTHCASRRGVGVMYWTTDRWVVGSHRSMSDYIYLYMYK